MKVQVLRLGAPADRFGDVFAPGCLEPATVPVCLEFDCHAVVGTARVLEDGSAELELHAGVELEPQSGTIEGGVGIGFVAEHWREEDGVRVMEEVRPVCLGISVKKGAPGGYSSSS